MTTKAESPVTARKMQTSTDIKLMFADFSRRNLILTQDEARVLITELQQAIDSPLRGHLIHQTLRDYFFEED